MNLREAIRAAQRDAILDGWRPDEPYEVRIKPALATAVWFWQPPHRIYVGTGVGRTMRPGLSIGDQNEMVASYLFHEYGHARHTCRDADATRALLTRVGCSMGLLNIFEDARIEQAWRQLTGRSFRWTEFEAEQPGRSATPLGALLEWIQCEGDAALISRLPDAGRCSEVESFYRRAVETPTTLELEALLAEWVERYGDAADATAYRFTAGRGEMQLAATLLDDPAAFAEFDADSGTVAADGNAEGDPLGTVEIDNHAESDLLAATSSEFGEEEARMHAERLLRVLTVRSRAFYGLSPSMRISAWRADAGRPAFRHRTDGRIVRRRRDLVLDCSGSMAGEHIAAARTLARVMSLLAEHGALDGELILSAVSGRVAVSESHRWPVPASVIERIHAFGNAEGLASAIDAHVAALRGAEKVYVFTDGDICDRPLALAALRRCGVEVIGLYVGDVERGSKGLTRHFDRFAARATLAGVVDFLVADG